MALNGARFERLLLLDLDGVVVFEAGPPQLAAHEILNLHRDLGERLAAAGLPVIVLTHRSRREAAVILEAAGLSRDRLLAVVAAEDLFLQGVKMRRFRQFLRGGLEKSLALNVAEKISGVPRGRMAIIDDRTHNLRALISAGIGLALHAPSRISDDGSELVTFDLDRAIALIGEWTPGDRKASPIPLPEDHHPIQEWRGTGVNTVRQGRHVFNRMRRFAYSLRRNLPLA